jgi:hypothetical protein
LSHNKTPNGSIFYTPAAKKFPILREFCGENEGFARFSSILAGPPSLQNLHRMLMLLTDLHFGCSILPGRSRAGKDDRSGRRLGKETMRSSDRMRMDAVPSLPGQ